MPGVDFLKCIDTYEEMERASLVGRGELVEQIDGVGDSPAIDVDRQSFEGRILRDRETDHFEAERRIRELAARLVGGCRRRDEEDPGEAEMLPGLFGRPQVSVVNRIEGAA